MSKCNVEVHMYVLQYMHEYTVNIDDTLISNLMYLQLVLLNLNISTCYWCSFLRINTLGQSMPYRAVTVSFLQYIIKCSPLYASRDSSPKRQIDQR